MMEFDCPRAVRITVRNEESETLDADFSRSSRKMLLEFLNRALETHKNLEFHRVTLLLES